MNLTEDEIARIIRDIENGGRYIHGMMPEAAARAIVMTAEKDTVIAEMASEMKVEKLHADTIDRVERYINRYHGGDCDIRTLTRVIIKLLDQEAQSDAEANDTLIQALKFYADNLIDGGSKARMALQLRATRKARRPDDVVR